LRIGAIFEIDELENWRETAERRRLARVTGLVDEEEVDVIWHDTLEVWRKVAEYGVKETWRMRTTGRATIDLKIE